MDRIFCMCWSLLVISLLTACAQTGQVVPLAPKAEVQGSMMGEGRDVAVRVVDERESPALGRLENRLRGSADLIAERDITQVVREAVVDGLQRSGFRPVAWNPDPERSLTVRIRELEHVVTSDMPRMLTTRVHLAFEAGRGDRGIGGNARYSHEEASATRPDAEHNGALISDGLEAALRRMLNERLLAFLAAGTT